MKKCRQHSRCISSHSFADPVFNAATTAMLSDLHCTVQPCQHLPHKVKAMTTRTSSLWWCGHSPKTVATAVAAIGHLMSLLYSPMSLMHPMWLLLMSWWQAWQTVHSTDWGMLPTTRSEWNSVLSWIRWWGRFLFFFSVLIRHQMNEHLGGTTVAAWLRWPINDCKAAYQRL